MTVLPEIHEGVLDDATLDQLFADIAALAEVISVTTKDKACSYTEEKTITLTKARRSLHDRSVRGVQVRYRYGGQEWWDTLIATSTGVRVVRIEHNHAESERQEKHRLPQHVSGATYEAY